MNISWEKVACALLAGALALSGWGLYMVHVIDVKVTAIEVAIGIFHQKIAPGTPDAMLAGTFIGNSCEERLDFLQLSSMKAYNSVKQHEYDTALRTIILGLEESGLHCKEYRNSLRCE